MHPETRVVGTEDSSSLQASQDEFENMVRNLDVKSRIMDQYADWKGVRYRLGGNTKKGIDCSSFVQRTFRGIYIGNDQFVHASTSSGVTISSMNEPYWKKRYNEARRVLTRS